MGQKIHPHGYRLGIIYGFNSLWYATKGQYKHFVKEDLAIREFLKKKLALAGLTHVEIKRSIGALDIMVHIARPGVVIGRGGSNLELLKKELTALVNKNRRGKQNQLNIVLHPMEVRAPDLSAHLVAERIAQQIEKRYPHRRAKDQAFERVMASGAKGIKIKFSGRINGAEIHRTEKYAHGKIPTQTLRADIDYAHVPALTRSGYVGVTVWIYKGEKKTV